MFAGKTLGVIGAGNMAEALIKGVLGAGLLQGSDIIACDLAEERRNIFKDMGCSVTADIMELQRCDIFLLAIKPQVIFKVLEDFGKILTGDQVLISIAAGVTTESIQKSAENARIIRVMPNTPMLAGEGVSGVAAGKSATPGDVAMALELCKAAGDAYEIAESQIDAVTGLSGSGPAYVFNFAEILAEAGVRAGLPAELAEKMATQTVYGAAKLLKESDDSAEELRKKVTSPNGTTEAALKVMQDKGLKSIMIDAVLRAKERSEELARGE